MRSDGSCVQPPADFSVTHAHHRITSRLIVNLLVTIALLFGAHGASVAAQTPAVSDQEESSCATSDFGYEVRLCLFAPPASDPLTADPLIRATVAIDDPDIEIRAVVFMLDSRNILSDFDPEYEFTLPLNVWADGPHVLSAKARLSDEHESVPVAVTLRFKSGTESPAPPERTFKPATGTAPASDEPFVVAAVGDGAGGSPESDAVTSIIGSWNPNMLLYLGDVYNAGTITEYQNWYAPQTSYGRFKAITNPTIGNHEYSSSQGPQGYMHYWGSPPHYYSVDANGWHIVSLDTNEKFNETDPESPQMQWLVDDLNAASESCTLVFFHHPPFSVGSHGNTEWLDRLWKVLADHKVTLVLAGHEHNYQRWQPLDASGNVSPGGTVSLVIGTGGQSEYSVERQDERLAAPAQTSPGALRLELNPNGAALQFITTDGIVRDSSVVECAAGDGAPDVTPPTGPRTTWSTWNRDGTVTLGWNSALDDSGILAYDIYRHGKLIGSVPPGSAFTDISPGEAPEYQIATRDGAGNISQERAFTKPVGQLDANVIFAEDFASGSLQRWTDVSGLTVEPAADVGTGWMARSRGGVNSSYARVELPGISTDQGQVDIAINIEFCALGQGNNPAVLFRLRSTTGESLFGVSISENGTIGLYNDLTSAGTNGVSQVTPGTRHTLVARLKGPQQAVQLTISLDGHELPELTSTFSLQDQRVGGLQLGDSRTNRVYDIQYYGIVVATDGASHAVSAVVRPNVPATGSVGGATSRVDFEMATSPIAARRDFIATRRKSRKHPSVLNVSRPGRNRHGAKSGSSSSRRGGMA